MVPLVAHAWIVQMGIWIHSSLLLQVDLVFSVYNSTWLLGWALLVLSCSSSTTALYCMLLPRRCVGCVRLAMLQRVARQPAS